MAVTLKTLLLAAPFPPDKRDELLRRYNDLNDDQKMQLSTTAWIALSEIFFSKLQYETNKLLLEVQEGKRPYNRNDFVEAETKLIHEFATKLEASESEDSIHEVRKQLEQFKTAPLQQDISHSPTSQNKN